MKHAFWLGACLTTLFLVATSCSKCTTERNADASRDVAIKELTGHKIHVPEAFDGIYYVAFKYGNLIYTSYDPAYVFVKGNFVGDSLTNIQRFVRKGFGPDDIQWAGINITRPDEFALVDNLWGYLGALSYWRPGPGNNFAKAQKTRTFHITDQNINAAIDDFIFVGKNKIMFTGASFDDPNTIVSTANYNDGRIKSLELWPEDEFKGPGHTKASAWDYMATLGADGHGTFVFSARVQPHVFLFTIDKKTGLAKIKKFIYNNPLKYKLRDDNLNFEYLGGVPNSVRLCWTEQEIYILTLDTDLTSRPGDKRRRLEYGDNIEVYDWDGNLRQRLHLDHKGKAIFIDEKAKTLYLGSRDPQTEDLVMYRYAL